MYNAAPGKMSKGEFLTRITVWITLAGYFAVTALIATSRDRHDSDRYFRVARLIWTLACASLLVHVAFAYHFYHQWSQESAYRETARQTAEVTGLNWGGGIYFNYALMAGWIIDVAWWWLGADAYRKRPRWIIAAWQAFLIFMIFNGMVVFKTGAIRMIGIVMCLFVGLIWLYTSAKGSRNELPQQ